MTNLLNQPERCCDPGDIRCNCDRRNTCKCKGCSDLCKTRGQTL